MKFLQKINDFVNSCDKDKCGTMDEAVLYDVYDQTPPLARHIIFNPMPKSVMESMIDHYKLTFPKQLLTIYSAMNGATFFWKVIFLGREKIRIPINQLSIYGIPLTYDRQHLEPFNISIEDLNRPKGTPDTWLKFGSFYRPDDMSDRFDLFVDVETEEVFAVKHGVNEDCSVTETWKTVDDCLCCVFDLLNSSST